MLVNTIERDARNDGWKAGIVQGKSLGFAEGSHQTKLETARILKQLGKLNLRRTSKNRGF